MGRRFRLFFSLRRFVFGVPPRPPNGPAGVPVTALGQLMAANFVKGEQMNPPKCRFGHAWSDN